MGKCLRQAGDTTPASKPAAKAPAAAPAATQASSQGAVASDHVEAKWHDPLNVCTLRTAGLSRTGAKFGMTRNNGTKAHQGIDLAAEPGTPIYAVANGTVYSNRSVLLPSAFERRQIFYWLKRVSSLTAWRRILAYYESWATATERSLLVAERNGWGADTSLSYLEYALLLQCMHNLEKGVGRLAKGDKSVFCFDRYGELWEASRIISHWVQMLDRLELGENSIKALTPLWSDFCDGVNSLGQAWGECGQLVLRTRVDDKSALLFYNSYTRHQLETMWFPAELEPVPVPIDNTFLWTGSHVPFSGIWEPMAAPQPSIFDVIFRSPAPQLPYEIAGTMNYLPKGSQAPQVSVQKADDLVDVDTTWRLLWKDDRYEDRAIPEEEAYYRFSKPETVLPPPPNRSQYELTIEAPSGVVVPHNGQWMVESRPESTVRFWKGDTLPLHDGCAVRWVFDQDQLNVFR